MRLAAGRRLGDTAQHRRQKKARNARANGRFGQVFACPARLLLCQPVLIALTQLIACQFAGEVIARALSLPLPGPVLGLLLMLAVLTARRGPGEELRSTSNALLRHLSLLFVPAGAGVVTELGPLAANWAPVGAAILVSTALGLAVAGWVMQRLTRG